MDNKQPFLWSLTETDITFCEVLMNMYAAISTNLNLSTDEATAALFAPADSYGQTFTEWGPYIAQEMGIPFSHNEQFTDNADLLRRLKDYYGELDKGSWDNSFMNGNFCVIESLSQLVALARTSTSSTRRTSATSTLRGHRSSSPDNEANRQWGQGTGS